VVLQAKILAITSLEENTSPKERSADSIAIM
jgi:hypothetical protein